MKAKHITVIDMIQDIMETALENANYMVVGVLGALYGVCWSSFKMLEISLESFLVGASGTLGTLLMKYAVDVIRERRKEPKSPNDVDENSD